MTTILGHCDLWKSRDLLSKNLELELAFQVSMILCELMFVIV
jgi:hypothetical protein